MKCRNCSAPLTHSVMDFGTSPPANSYLNEGDLAKAESWYPLEVLACTSCWLVQLGENVDREFMFSNDYAYFSSTSVTFVEHALRYVEEMVQRFSLHKASHFAEVASNDGYLLQHVKRLGIPCYGIEPTASTADAARQDHGLEVISEFFSTELGMKLAERGRQVDLVAANNVLAHVPDIRDFMGGFSYLLKPGGVATFEFPSLVELVQKTSFDTVYHEHYSYLSLCFIDRLARSCGLRVFDVQQLDVHGGSLRVFTTHADNAALPTCPAVSRVLAHERQLGVESASFYEGFTSRSQASKDALIAFLIDAKARGEKVAAYGAAAKGNTFLNYAGIKSDLLPFVVDNSPSKQGKYLPGSRIPVFAPDKIAAFQPDYLLILPWNIKEEVMAQQRGIGEWGGRFVTAIPSLEIVAEFKS